MQKQSPAAELLLHRMGALPCRWDFTIRPPVFRCIPFSDVEENAEKYVQYYIGLLESTNITKHEILSRGYREGSSLDTYLIQFSATESGGTTMEFLAAFIECQNGFGCYNLIGSYPQGDEKAQAEIFAAMDSFRSNGPAGTIYQRFYDENLPFQFLYWEDESEIQFTVLGESRLRMEKKYGCGWCGSAKSADKRYFQ